jgi:hypothetical protein
VGEGVDEGKGLLEVDVLQAVGMREQFAVTAHDLDVVSSADPQDAAAGYLAGICGDQELLIFIWDGQPDVQGDECLDVFPGIIGLLGPGEDTRSQYLVEWVLKFSQIRDELRPVIQGI